jgi:proteasome assembly chaperone (PAC2) family protein
MLYKEIISFSSEFHTKHIHTLCGQNVEFLSVKTVVVRIVSNVRVKDEIMDGV